MAEAVSDTASTIEVREQHRLDEAALADWLAGHVAGFAGPLSVRQFGGGQSNPTYLLSTPGGRYVLRKKPPGKLLPSAHAVEREHRAISALGAAGIPVARALCLCEDPSVVGTPFYVTGFVTGRVFRDPLLPSLPADQRRAVYDAMNDVLARLHRVDYAAAGLADFGRPGNYYARQIGRWTQQYRAAETAPILAMERLIEWLPAHLPEDDETTVVHGDYRLENMIFHPSRPEVLAVLDWELATLGHPLADLAYNCMPYHMAIAGMPSLRDLDPACGIPSEADYLAAYCRRTGRPAIAGWNFYMAFSLFRSAGILQGVYKRGLQGNAASATAMRFGTIVPQLADTAWALVAAA